MSDLSRFIKAQSYNYADALAEIKNGRKLSCWMWYVFPQIIRLGRTDTTAAIAGRLAGLHYGYDGIPGKWVEQLVGKTICVHKKGSRFFPCGQI